jgi:hypothetical protein
MTNENNCNMEVTNYNTLVALSDYQAAIQGIENVPIPNETGGNDFVWDDAQIHLFQQTKESFIKNLARIVHPIPDEEYHRIMNRNIVIQDDGSTTDDSSAIDEEEEEEEEEDDKVVVDDDTKNGKNTTNINMRWIV